VILKKYISSIISHAHNATYGNKRNQSLTLKEKESKIAAKAHATQKTLCELDAKIDAKIHHHIQVKSPCNGEAPDATAREIDNGILIMATDNQAFQFKFKL
jgi:hypothetical protein